MLTRPFVSFVVVIALLVALVACGADERAGPAKGLTLTSPPPPPRAPALAIMAAASALSVAVTASDQGCVSAPSQTEGTPVAVSLEDAGGSGAYVFDPDEELTFTVGQTVTFTLTAETEFHTFTVDELGIDQCVDAEGTVKLTFTFDKPGAYKLICIPHQSEGMVGEILIQ